MKITKKEQVKNLIEKGDFKKAFSIARNFNREFDKDEQRMLQIAHETLNGNGNFYEKLNIDTSKMVEDAKEFMKKYQ